MNALTPRNRRALWFALVILAAASMWSAWSGRGAGVFAIQNAIDDERRLLARQKALIAAIDSAVIDQTTARGFLPGPDPFLASVELARYVDRVARLSGVHVESSVPSVGGRERSIVTVGAELRGETDFEGLLRLLDRLEASELALVTASLEVLARNRDASAESLALRIVVNGFVADRSAEVL